MFSTVTIRTCHGWETYWFLDGALLSPRDVPGDLLPDTAPLNTELEVIESGHPVGWPDLPSVVYSQAF